MARPRSETARRKILLAAREVVAARGVDGFTIDEVARQSGVAKSTIYRHFESGHELLLAGCDALVDEVVIADTGSLRSDLRAALTAFLALADAPWFRHMILSFVIRAQTDAAFAVAYRELREQRHLPLRRIIQRAISRGEVDPEIDITLAIYIIEGPFVVKRLIENEPISDTDIEMFVEAIVRALCPSPGDDWGSGARSTRM
jgi:AcrR family transcriptional regulator